MNVARLRAIMRRYKELGVLMVGAYLIGHHLWHKRRVVLLMTPAMVLLLICGLAGIRTRPTSVPQSSPVLSMHPAPPRSQGYLPQKPLLAHAHAVIALGEHYFEHFWISENRLLLITSVPSPRKPDDDSIDGGLTAWHGQAKLVDLPSGRVRKLEGLTRVFNHMGATPGYFETSPGGKWLMWINYITPDGWPNPAVARWDGSGFQQWSMDKFSDTYWLDDHRWVEEETRSYDETEYPKELIIHDADRQKTSVLKLKSKAGQKLARAHQAVCEHEFTTGWREETSEVTISEEKSSNQSIDESGYVSPLYFYSITMPAGADVQKILVCPKTRRVLYVLRFQNIAEGVQAQPKYGVFDLRTSRLDGSDMKDLGYVEAGELNYTEEKSPTATQELSGVEWLPDGKHFSFLYRGKLYRVDGD